MKRLALFSFVGLVLLGTILWFTTEKSPSETRSSDVLTVSSTPDTQVSKPHPPKNHESESEAREAGAGQKKSESTLKKERVEAPPPSTDSRPTDDYRELDPTVFSSSDYSGYDRTILEQLVTQGDLTAMQVLAMRLMTQDRSDENIDRAKKLMQEAAARGARNYPFRTLAAEAGFELELALQKKIEMNESEMQNKLVETFAYAELADIRGNAELKRAIREKYSERYDIRPSDEQQHEIRSLAESMYKQLQSEREQLGLGPFENTASAKTGK